MPRRTTAPIVALLFACGLAGCTTTHDAAPAGHASGGLPAPAGAGVELGNFSVSLTVKDLAASRTFYEKLGFHAIGGDPARNWLILRNGSATIGLFQGMFERNTLTFNPGWSTAGTPLATFEDIRDIQRELERRGLTLTARADGATTGPASLMLIDPDGNPILIDQHVPKPVK